MPGVLLVTVTCCDNNNGCRNRCYCHTPTVGDCKGIRHADGTLCTSGSCQEIEWELPAAVQPTAEPLTLSTVLTPT